MTAHGMCGAGGYVPSSAVTQTRPRGWFPLRCGGRRSWWRRAAPTRHATALPSSCPLT